MGEGGEGEEEGHLYLDSRDKERAHSAPLVPVEGYTLVEEPVRHLHLVTSVPEHDRDEDSMGVVEVVPKVRLPSDPRNESLYKYICE